MTKKVYRLLAGVILVIAFFLRVYQLDQVPPGLYWEEVALGYDAYSIAKTARDHHGNFLPLAAFESFGDWKPSLYFYATVVTTQLFGLNVWGVRLPSVIAGVMIVLGVGRLVCLVLHQELKNEESVRQVSLVGMMISAIMPWALHFSRGGWESNLAAALVLWGLIFGLKFLQARKFCFLTISTVFLVLSTYSYHSTRISAVLIGFGLIVSAIRSRAINLKQNHHGCKLVGILVMAVILMIPLISKFSSGILTQRAAETSIFSRIEVIEQSNLYRQLAGNSWLARIFYHRYFMFAREIVLNFLDHFHLDFLLVSGDPNPRHSIQYFGQLFFFEIIPLAAGLVYLFKAKLKQRWLLVWWLVAGIFPASLTKTTPHALRILAVMPWFGLMITLGWHHLFTQLKIALSDLKVGERLTKLLVLSAGLLVVGAYLFETLSYWDYYLKIYPKKYAAHWQVGYEQAMQALGNARTKHPDYQVYITRSQGRPAMYYWFYQQTDPRKVQASAASAKKDQSEILEFERIKFGHGLEQVCETKCLALLTQEEYQAVRSSLNFTQAETVYTGLEYSWVLATKLE